MGNELFAALADDLAQLIRLHDRELDAPTLAALQEAAFPEGLALPASDAAEAGAYANMAAALAASLDLEQLAADYAAIYLNNSLGASPYESVWLSEEHLACEAPMFELRECYAAAGWRVADWRRRFDDHLVLQLQYLGIRLRSDDGDPAELAGFIDEHIGYWLPEWAERVSQLCATAFYAALAELTHVWLRRFRQLLADIHDLPVPPREQLRQRIQAKLAREKAEVAPIRFMPGAQGPSW